MKILLPPSEGKAPSPGRGSPVKLSSLSLPELTATRSELITALTKLCQGPRAKAVSTLGLTPGLAREVEKNAQLLTAPAIAAGSLYSGVSGGLQPTSTCEALGGGAGRSKRDISQKRYSTE